MTPSLREQFARDGVVMVPGVVSSAWIDRLRAAADLLITAGERPRFHSLANPHRVDPVWLAFARDGGAAAAAGELLGAAAITLYADVLLVKESGTAEQTAWHQDLPFWPFRGDRLCTAWTALDETHAGNGRIEYVAGSHLWGRWFAPAGLPVRAITDGTVEIAPAGDTLRANQRILSWDMAPGDVLVHHPLILHGAGGNGSPAPRRACAMRLAGEGTHYTGETIVGPQRMALAPGEPIERDPAHPTVWRSA